jgi:hypothetical protein
MCRDVIIINGIRYTGIESVLCALMRTLVDAAERIRMLQIQKQQKDGTHFHYFFFFIDVS